MMAIIAGCSLAEVDFMKQARVDGFFHQLNTGEINSPRPGDIIDVFKLFCEGVWEGVVELARWDIRMFPSCARVINDTLTDVKEFIHKISRLKRFDLVRIIALINLLVNQVRSHVAPCLVALGFTTHFLDLFRHLSWSDVERRFGYTALTNAFSVFQDVITMLVCAFKGLPKCSGQAFGQLFYLMIFH